MFLNLENIAKSAIKPQRKPAIETAISLKTEVRDFNSVVNIPNMPFFGVEWFSYNMPGQGWFFRVCTSLNEKNMSSDMYFGDSSKNITLNKLSAFSLVGGMRNFLEGKDVFIEPEFGFIFFSNQEAKTSFLGYLLGAGLGCNYELFEDFIIQPVLGLQLTYMAAGTIEYNSKGFGSPLMGLGYTLKVNCQYVLDWR
ncbi:hypothetical protein ACFLZV_01915 [Candidatus Margulisiibacteriota bacterium]